MSAEEAAAWLTSPSGVAAVEAGARALWEDDRPNSAPEWGTARLEAFGSARLYRELSTALLSAVLVGGLLIPKDAAACPICEATERCRHSIGGF